MFLEGLLLSFGLIAAIGPQNAFVIRQGLKRQFVFTTALLTSLCDALLILVGVLGVGQILAQNKFLKLALVIGGAIFLSIYGIKSLLRAFKKETLKVDSSKAAILSHKKIILQAISFSLLNPHAILDTTVIIGSVSAQYPIDGVWKFACGAISASFLWFFMLCYGAKSLSGYLQKPIVWKIIDISIGVVCLCIAGSLLFTIMK